MSQSLNIVLFQPVIPQNTGSIARLCACTGSTLHLIHPLGFQIDEASVKRAGLDYWPHVAVKEHRDWEQFLSTENPGRDELYLFSKFAKQPYTKFQYPKKVYLVFGSETKGLPAEMREAYQNQLLLIPMRTHLVRSLNLSQAAAIVTYEVLRQWEFPNISGTTNIS